MDLREKMAMMRAQAGQPITTKEPKLDSIQEAAIVETPIAEEVTEALAPKEERIETLSDKTAEKKLLMQIQKSVKKLDKYVTGDDFAKKVAELVVARMNEEISNA